MKETFLIQSSFPLLLTLSDKDILVLTAYILSGGDRKHNVFAK